MLVDSTYLVGWPIDRSSLLLKKINPKTYGSHCEYKTKACWLRLDSSHCMGMQAFFDQRFNKNTTVQYTVLEQSQ
jgi:hypothetical protein